MSGSLFAATRCTRQRAQRADRLAAVCRGLGQLPRLQPDSAASGPGRGLADHPDVRARGALCRRRRRWQAAGKPPAELAPLQTAYVFGLKSGYLDAFLQGLIDNGVPDAQRIECDVSKHIAAGSAIGARHRAAARDFQVSASGQRVAHRHQPRSGVADGFDYQLTSKLEGRHCVGTAGHSSDRTSLLNSSNGRCCWIATAVYREMVEWKRTQRWWNFAFDRQAIDSALASDKYEILGMPGMLDVRESTDLVRLNRLAATVVRPPVRRRLPQARKPEESLRADCRPRERHSGPVFQGCAACPLDRTLTP